MNFGFSSFAAAAPLGTEAALFCTEMLKSCLKRTNCFQVEYRRRGWSVVSCRCCLPQRSRVSSGNLRLKLNVHNIHPSGWETDLAPDNVAAVLLHNARLLNNDAKRVFTGCFSSVSKLSHHSCCARALQMMKCWSRT